MTNGNDAMRAQGDEKEPIRFLREAEAEEVAAAKK